jgi:hypothetical protein
MQQHRFDGYALDYVECPDAMKFFLMRDLNLHRVVRTFRLACYIVTSLTLALQPIALNGSAVDVNAVMALVARPIPDFHHPGGANFVNGRTLNVVTRSRYGRKAISNMTRDIQEARNFTAHNSELFDPSFH